MSALIDELICQRRLRYFSYYEHLSREQNIRFLSRGLRVHQRSCALPYRDQVLRQGTVEVFCVCPKSLAKERKSSAYIASIMGASDEIPADLVGWYPRSRLSDPTRDKSLVRVKLAPAA